MATVAVLDAAEADILYDGIYIAGFESGAFSMARQGDRGVIFIGHTDAAAAQILKIEPKIYFYSGAKVTSGGDFVLTDNGTTKLSGKADTASVFGKFDSARATFSGAPKTGGASTYTGPNGVLYGSLSGASDSLFIALIGSDASATFYMRSGTSEDVSVSGNLASDGTFNVATLRGGTLSGRVDPATGFLTGTITGSPVSGTVTGAVSTPAPAADGFLRNLSTRGRVGSGDAILVAGFVVNGTSAKQVLIRAIGPTLGSFGVSGVVSDPYLKLYRGSTVLASNDDWGTAPGVPAASSIVGAFALPSGSSDSALLATLTPGPYTAQVSGVGGATGVGLVEIYDVDTQTAFSAEKVLNVSTRGEVGAGDKNLIAGVNINGTTPKRVLIRAIGPTLGEFGVANPLADPVLRLVRQSDGVTVRENNDWGLGNEATDVAEAAAAIGAFALPAGSKDAVLLITLPPGSYTALVTSGSGSTGVAIVEVYEVP